MPCLGPNSFLHVTLVISRRILISALEAARPFGHYAVSVHTKPFVLQSSTSFCNASCISFQSSLSVLAKPTLFYRWRRLFAVLQVNTCLWNASFQLYAPEDDKTGNMSALLKPADSCAGLAKKCVLVALTNHLFTWKNAFPLCCLSGFLIPVTGKLHVKLLALEDMRCLGLESVSGSGSFLAAETSGNNGLDRLRGGAYILTEGQNLFVPPSDHLAAVEKRMWTRSPLA